MKQGNVAKSRVLAGLVAGAIGLVTPGAFAFDYGVHVFPDQYYIYSMSYSGNMVCGYSNAGAFYSTGRATTFVYFGTQYNADLYGGEYTALNNDGTVKAGHADTTFGDQAVIDRGSGDFQFVGEIARRLVNKPVGLSGDGSVALVESYDWRDGGATVRLYYQNGTSIAPTNAPPNVLEYRAFDLSRDGSTVVGRCLRSVGSEFDYAGYIWSPSSGVQLLVSGDDTGRIVDPACVSADGSVVAGSVGGVPCIWAGGSVTTAPFPGDSNGGTFVEMNDNGTVMVGHVNLRVDGPYVPFGAVWTTSDGWILAADYFAAYGIAIPEGRRIASLEFVSSDATTFCGVFDNGQYFVAAIPAPASLATLVSLGVLGARRRR